MSEIVCMHMCIKSSSGPFVQTFKNFVFLFGKHTKTNTDAVHGLFGTRTYSSKHNMNILWTSVGTTHVSHTFIECKLSCCVFVCVYGIRVCMCMGTLYIHICIYIYREREREKERHTNCLLWLYCPHSYRSCLFDVSPMEDTEVLFRFPHCRREMGNRQYMYHHLSQIEHMMIQVTHLILHDRKHKLINNEPMYVYMYVVYIYIYIY